MGKLIVIEGTDGSGKSTQFKRLSEPLEQDAVAFKYLVFPRYKEEISAQIPSAMTKKRKSLRSIILI